MVSFVLDKYSFSHSVNLSASALSASNVRNVKTMLYLYTIKIYSFVSKFATLDLPYFLNLHPSTWTNLFISSLKFSKWKNNTK
ncbi:MAG: hypothetical protein ACI8VT_001456, partial [Saprospiraceae bacterium]